MAFIGKTAERKITTNGKTYKIFLTEQIDGCWVATSLYADGGVISTHNEIGQDKADAYKKACDWVFNNIDGNAQIEAL